MAMKSKEQKAPQVDWADVHYQVRAGFSRKSVLDGVKAQNPEIHMSYPRFCANYQTWLKQFPEGSQVHAKPGEEMVLSHEDVQTKIQLPGKKDPVVLRIFFALLPASGYLILDMFEARSSHQLFGCMQQTFEKTNGTTERTILQFKDASSDLLSATAGYDTRVVKRGKRFAKPTGCSTQITSAIRFVMEKVASNKPGSAEQLRSLLCRLSSDWNRQCALPLQVTRERYFEEVESLFLNLLPAKRPCFTDCRVARVPPNNHVIYDGYHYSVPFELTGQEVRISASSDRIQVFRRDCIVAEHDRAFIARRGQYFTNPDHMATPSDRNSREWPPERLIVLAHYIGPNAVRWITDRLEEAAYPEHAYNSCFGALQLARQVKPNKMERACRKANQSKHSSISHLRSLVGS
ncbi:hypothetical protein [Marinobacter sp. S0848L]|uniref:Mu transposase domain-containing protein n=1 Tax=Marinobacter sp. S0848L TaxID=2926423 RepID=UPI001FF5E4E0|nr:hypothetical protein [Marinobacter sp. S0848L]MCK0106959.1 hypothetical protein [Marinobacter sp. S0848L]